MTHCKPRLLAILGASVAFAVLPQIASAQETVPQETVEAVTEGESARYSLVAVDGDILRIDRRNGTVSICSEKASAWRCNPVPLAEEAYLSEINDLAEEVDRLSARVKELEAGEPASPQQSQSDEPLAGSQSDSSDDEQISGLDKKDEEDLEKVLDFTESAMRRLFGMVRNLQDEFEGSTKQ